MYTLEQYATIREVAALMTSEERVKFEQQLQQAAKNLESRLGEIPFFAERAAKDQNYWRELASSAVNAQ